jgi:folylpolyglutamate synthase/dihydropteroate synthase
MPRSPAVLKPAETYLPPEAIEQDLAATVAGFDQRGKWLFDVAHNPDGVAALCRTIEEVMPPRPLHALVSILGEKAWPEMLVRLDTVVDRGILHHHAERRGRRWIWRWFAPLAGDPNRPKAQTAWQPNPRLHAALRRVQQDAGTVLVTGSFHTVGDVMETLGFGIVYLKGSDGSRQVAGRQRGRGGWAPKELRCITCPIPGRPAVTAACGGRPSPGSRHPR